MLNNDCINLPYFKSLVLGVFSLLTMFAEQPVTIRRIYSSNSINNEVPVAERESSHFGNILPQFFHIHIFFFFFSSKELAAQSPSLGQKPHCNYFHATVFNSLTLPGSQGGQGCSAEFLTCTLHNWKMPLIPPCLSYGFWQLFSNREWTSQPTHSTFWTVV